MRLRAKKPALAGALLLLVALLALVASAQAEQDQSGNIIASFHGGIAPLKLPRDELAPVTVQMGGKIKTTDKSAPPKLEQIVLEINSNGQIQTKGLPQCALAKLNSVSAASAK